MWNDGEKHRLKNDADSGLGCSAHNDQAAHCLGKIGINRLLLFGNLLYS